MSAGGPCSSWPRSGASSWAAPMRCRGSTGEGQPGLLEVWGNGQIWSTSALGRCRSTHGEAQLGALSRSARVPRVGTRIGVTHGPAWLTCRDADETKEWIEEKNQALNTDNYGHDLASVQALQRKHEGFERDLAALGDKVRGRAWERLPAMRHAQGPGL